MFVFIKKDANALYCNSIMYFIIKLYKRLTFLAQMKHENPLILMLVAVFFKNTRQVKDLFILFRFSHETGYAFATKKSEELQ